VVKRLLAIALLLGCNSVLGLKEGKLRTADAGPTPDSPFGIGNPDARPRPDSPPGTPDAARPDGGGADAQTGCDVVTQSCPANESCDLQSSGNCGTVCRMFGGVGLGQVCTAATDCARGLVCAGFSSSATGTCHGLCDLPNGNGCPANWDCVFPACATGTGPAICLEECDPLTSSGCAGGQKCVSSVQTDPTNNTTFMISDCVVGTMFGLLQDCTPDLFGCPTGSTCYFPNAQQNTATCQPLCHQNSDCPTSAPNCVPFSPPAMLGPVGWNHCS
jgi:hypothetical protein